MFRQTLLQVYPRCGSKRPGLLNSLEECKRTGQRNEMRQFAVGPFSCTAANKQDLGKHIDVLVASRSLDVFAAGFPSYLPLLMQTKDELERFASVGLKCLLECSTLPAKIRQAQRANATASKRSYLQVRDTHVVFGSTCVGICCCACDWL